MTTQAYIYRRFSTDEQEFGAGDTLSRQKERCEAFALENGWVVTEIMADKGKSAFKGEHLYPDAELGGFVARVQRGEIPIGSVLMAERLDRLSRRPVAEAMAWIHTMTATGVKIAIADTRDVFGVDQDMGSFLATAIRVATGHEESRKKSEQTTLSKAKLWKMAEARTGKWANLANKIPSWLIRKPGCDGFDVDEKRAAVVRQIFQMSADGVGVNTITRHLNEAGVSPFAKAIKYTSHLHQWGRSGVRQILISPNVEGDFRPANGAHRGRVIHDFYPRIVDADTVARARSDLKDRRRVSGKPAASGSKNLFAGVMRCGECGCAAFMSTSVQKGKAYTYIRCERAGEKRCENTGGYAYRAFEEAALDVFLDLALDDRFFEASGDLRESRVKKAEIEKQMVDKRAFRARLLQKFGDGDDQAVEMIMKVREEIDALTADLAEADQAISTATGKVGHIEHLKRCGDIREAAKSEDPEVSSQARSKLRLALKAIVQSVEIERDPEGVKVFTAIVAHGIMAVRITDKGKVQRKITHTGDRPISDFLSSVKREELAPLLARIEKMAA